MVKVFTETDHEYYMDGYLKNAFDTAIKEIRNDWDFLFVYDGMEGSGKSVKAMQDAFYCDPNMDLMTQYSFSPYQFKKSVLAAKQYQAIVYDEAHSGLNSRAAMSMINRSLVSMLTEIRQKNLFVFIVLPTFFDLDKYVALWRSRALIHVYTGKKLERGFFAFYNMDRKKSLYVNGKKYYSYFKPSPNFRGRFTNFYAIDEVKYRKKKKDSLLKRSSTEEQAIIQEQVRNSMFERLVDVEGITNAKKAKILGIPEGTYYYKLKNYQEMGEI